MAVFRNRPWEEYVGKTRPGNRAARGSESFAARSLEARLLSDRGTPGKPASRTDR